MYEIKGFKPRLYQQTIMHSTIKSNTLIVLPTGMGKTKTAILSAIQRLNSHPNSKILFLTPTKPLAAQIQEEFIKCTSIDNNRILLFTGAVRPFERAKKWMDAKIIVSTPQGLTNDIINQKADLSKVSCIFFDECHHAVGDYDYVFIAKQYFANAKFPRIVGLTASPGSDIEKIKEVCKNLYIEEIEARTTDDVDVQPYVQKLETNYLIVELPDDMKKIKYLLDNCFKSKLTKIKELGFISSTNYTTKKDLLNLQKEIQKRIATGERDYSIWLAVSILAEAIKIGHASNLLETQDISPLYSYFKKLVEEGEKKKSKASKNLVIDPNFKEAYLLTRILYKKGEVHPKLKKLKEIASEKIRKNPKAKFMVFSQYRESSVKIASELNKINGIKAKIFVGQLKKRGTGLSQKEQIKLIEDFKKGIFNCMIATTVGEEGLDIPSVDEVIFYEPVPSAIRSIQRKGRTARINKGKVTILITKNTRDEIYRWTSYHKERKMYNILKELKSKLKLESQPVLSAFSKGNKENVRVIVDQREKGSGIAKEFSERNVEVELKSLDVGDFIVSDRIGIERKSIRDFVNSIIDGRLIPQIKALSNNFERPILLLEGTEDIYSVRNMHPNAIRGAVSMIVASFGIPIVHTRDMKDTASMIISIAKREQQGAKTDFGVRLERKPLTTKEQQEFIIESLPGIGPSLAKSLLKEFKTVKKIFNAKEEELTKVTKIGEKKSEEIIRIIHEEYEAPNE